jgi:beta-lactamase class A
MAALLFDLAGGKLLSPASTRFMLEVMRQTATGTDRLKAGVAPGWTLGHKTGTSGTWRGVTAATNDAGILESPAGKRSAVVVFIADSDSSAESRAGVMARIAAWAIAGR